MKVFGKLLLYLERTKRSGPSSVVKVPIGGRVSVVGLLAGFRGDGVNEVIGDSGAAVGDFCGGGGVLDAMAVMRKASGSDGLDCRR